MIPLLVIFELSEALGGYALKKWTNAKNIDFCQTIFLLLIIDNNIDSIKNKMQWEESAYQISRRWDQNWKRYMGWKFSKKGGKY